MHGAGRQGEVGCSEMLRGFDSHQYENRVNCGTRKVNRYSGIRTLDRIGLADLSVWTLCVCCCSCISGRRCMEAEKRTRICGWPRAVWWRRAA